MEHNLLNKSAFGYILSQVNTGNLTELKIKISANKIVLIESTELVEKEKSSISKLLNQHSHQVINVKTSGFNKVFIERIYKRKF